MKTIYVTLLIFISIFTIIVSNAFAAEEKILSYSLCKENIQKVKMGSTSRGFYINIKLSDKATVDFAQLTENNIGRN